MVVSEMSRVKTWKFQAAPVVYSLSGCGLSRGRTSAAQRTCVAWAQLLGLDIAFFGSGVTWENKAEAWISVGFGCLKFWVGGACRQYMGLLALKTGKESRIKTKGINDKFSYT